ncbi:uncharacterized protein [Temnothorax longispinosus]|uniref:uncharacterized protein n=1 Tax=Temnothorax longispinosus TaxID=300112 RepID=UPI003A9A52E9
MFNSSSMFQGLKGKRKEKIWQLFRATDFVSLMYPCFWFCRILGIFPYKINASTIKTCKPRYILSTIIICVFCILELINLYDANISKNYVVEKVGIPEMLDFNSSHIVGGFIVLTTFILSGPRMRLLQTILELSLKLPPKSYQNLSGLIHAKDIIGFSFLVVQMWIYFNLIRNVLRTFLLLYIGSLIFIMDMLYMNCVCILKACFKQINDNLANLRELVTNGEPYCLSGTYHEQRISFLLMEIIALKKRHLAINDSVQTLKMVFSLHLLSTIAITFIQITLCLYYYLMKLHGGEPLSKEEIQIYYNACIMAVTYNSIKLVLIVWACETGKNQAMEISTTVYEVFNSASDKQIKYELQLFSLQLSHCENRFSAKGLTVDATLLTAMAGGIITYLVILVQFLVTWNSCNEKSVMDSI